MGHRYRIRQVPLEKVGEGWRHANDLSGSIDLDGTAGIRLHDEINADYMETVTLHEALHAMFSYGNIVDLCPKKDDEPIVRALAPILRDTLRRNPQLVAYITGRN